MMFGAFIVIGCAAGLAAFVRIINCFDKRESFGPAGWATFIISTVSFALACIVHA